MSSPILTQIQNGIRDMLLNEYDLKEPKEPTVERQRCYSHMILIKEWTLNMELEKLLCIHGNVN
jgi:hypothetical protein